MLYVGPDTAVTHLAAATGVPTVALYGPTNHLKWAPWPADYAKNQSPFINKGGVQQVGNVILIQGLQDCVPCHQEGCERHLSSKSRCLEELDSMIVIRAVQNLVTLKSMNIESANQSLHPSSQFSNK
jgi:heptosyltransferase-3